MKQFYRVEVPKGEEIALTFDAPVRKFMAMALRSATIRIPYSNKTNSDRFHLPQNIAVTFDLQSANGGKGCTSLILKSASSSSSQESTVVQISIVEYGSDGDNDWYK